MYPQGVCRIRKPAYAGNGCAIFPAFDAEERAEKIRSSAADDLFRGSLECQTLRRVRTDESVCTAFIVFIDIE